jgi:hypothetical protein
MVAGNLYDRTISRGRGNAERVSCTLDDQRRDGRFVQLVETALRGGTSGSAPRLQRERKAEHTDRSGRLGGAARHSRPHRPAAGDEREPLQLTGTQMVEHCDPGDVELAWRSRGTASGDAIGLLHEGDAETLRARHVRNRHEVSRGHASGCSVPEYERGTGLVGRLQVNPRLAVRRGHW